MLAGLLADHRAGGITADPARRRERTTDPRRRAAALPRRRGTCLALTGAAPPWPRTTRRAAARGTAPTRSSPTFLDTAAADVAAFVAGLRRNVQTNEVGRAAVLASGFNWIAARTGLPIDQLEVGSSAGLLSRWDRFAYDTGVSRCGDQTSAVRFGPEWWLGDPAHRPDLAAGATVVRRRASDISPIDVDTADGRTTMASFVWPDQLERIHRLRAAMSVATSVALHLDAGRRRARGSARSWRMVPPTAWRRSCSTRSCGSTCRRPPGTRSARARRLPARGRREPPAVLDADGARDGEPTPICG